MSRRAKNAKQTGKDTTPEGRASRRLKYASDAERLPADYWKACELARDGQYDNARAAYALLERSAPKAGSRLRVLIQNDLAVLAAMEGNLDEACQGWRAAINGNGECLPARLNLGLVEAERTRGSSKSEARNPKDEPVLPSLPPSPALRTPSAPRVAVLSLLFNWPSTGGGLGFRTVSVALIRAIAIIDLLRARRQLAGRLGSA